jgi:hypothetical protein
MNRDLMVGDAAGKIGMGLIAGLLGTAAITASQRIEMRLRQRPPSNAPATAASKVLDVDDVLEQADDTQKRRLSQIVHWGYGTIWGGARALLDVIGLEGIGATLAQFAAIWTTAVTVMPSLEGSKPVTEWKPQEVAISAVHHAVYAVTVDLVYELLKQRSSEGQRHWYSALLRR